MFLPESQPGRDTVAIRTPPFIIVEVVSPRPPDRRRDRVAKLAEYARFGVAQYWLVDPEARVLEILKMGPDGHYVLICSASVTAVRPPDCEGLVIDLPALWAKLDSLPPGEQ